MNSCAAPRPRDLPRGVPADDPGCREISPTPSTGEAPASQGSAEPAGVFLGARDSPPAEHKAKRRRCDLAEAQRPIWGCPPAWMYLPHLGIGGGRDLLPTSSCTSASLHAGADDYLEVAGAAAIRGRASSPGIRRPPRLAVDSRRIGALPEQDPASSPLAATPKPRSSDPRSDSARSKAEAKLAARNAGIATSLADHAERVDKRSAQGRQPPVQSVAERMAALRRRLEERVSGKRSAGPIDDAAACGQGQRAAAEQATHGSRAAPTSKEDGKIHLLQEARRIHSATAKRPQEMQPVHERCGDGGGTLEEDRGGAWDPAPRPGAARPAIVGPLNTAAASAASRVAWHSTADTAQAD